MSTSEQVAFEALVDSYFQDDEENPRDEDDSQNKIEISRKQETGNKSTGPKPKQCQARAFELVYDVPLFDSEDVFPELCKRTYGIYSGFAIKHTVQKPGEFDHIHCGVYLRDKPASRSFTWGKSLGEYFKIKGCTPLVRLLKCKSRKPEAKLQQYYDYCTNKDKHPDQIIGEPALHKFKPADKTDDGVDLQKCKTKVYVFHYYKAGKSFNEIFEQASEKRQAEMMYDLSALKKMLRNYDLFTTDHTVHRDVTEFKPKVVKRILDNWEPTKEALILQGPSNMGKTELAKAIAKKITGKSPLFTSNLNKLTSRSPHQPIIYDDMNFHEVGRSKAIALTDVENDRDIRILYGIHTIEAQTVRIFTTNEDIEDFLPMYKDPHGAIQRRFRVINLEEHGKLY